MKKEEIRRQDQVNTWLVENKDASKGIACLVQSFQRGHEPLVEPLPLHALGGIVEGEEFRRRVTRTHPMEWGLILRGRAVTL